VLLVSPASVAVLVDLGRRQRLPGTIPMEVMV
jgi:hypothetical protein